MLSGPGLDLRMVTSSSVKVSSRGAIRVIGSGGGGWLGVRL